MSLLPICLAVSLAACPVTAESPPRTVVKIASRNQAGEEVVAVLVDTNDAPDLAAWGQRAGGLCVEWVPKIAVLLPSEGFVPARQVTLHFDPKMKGVAATSGTRITIAAEWVRRHPDDFGMVIHELTHVVQDYRGQGEGWLTEGIADYVRYWHFEPGTQQFAITRGKSSYREGYGVAGAFLDWLERTKLKGIVVKLNAASRKGDFQPGIFETLCGKGLDPLWDEFVEANAKP